LTDGVGSGDLNRRYVEPEPGRELLVQFDAKPVDQSAPKLGFGVHESGEISRGARVELDPEGNELLSHSRILHGLGNGLGESSDDWLRRTCRRGETEPDANGKPRKAGLSHCRHIW